MKAEVKDFVYQAVGRLSASGALEKVARFAGRHLKGARLSDALIHHSREVSLRAAPQAWRRARLPGDAWLAFTLNDWLGMQLYFKGDYEVETTKFFLRVLRPGDIVLDVGANIGYFMALSAKRVGPGGRVHAFEPNPGLLEGLRRTLAMNAFSNVTLHPVAVTSTHGSKVTLHLAADPGSSGVSSLQPLPHLENGRTVDVESESLDHFVESHQVSRVRILKLDVEGAEVDALRGARELLRKVRPNYVVAEVQPNAVSRDAPTEIVKLLGELGYRPHLIERSGELAAFRPAALGTPGLNLCFAPES